MRNNSNNNSNNKPRSNNKNLEPIQPDNKSSGNLTHKEPAFYLTQN